jgi:hypothetical protein
MRTMKGRIGRERLAVFLMVFGPLVAAAIIAVDPNSVGGEVQGLALAAAYAGTLCFMIGWLLFGTALTSASSPLRGAAAMATVYLVIGFSHSQVARPIGSVTWPVVLIELLALMLTAPW